MSHCTYRFGNLYLRTVLVPNKIETRPEEVFTNRLQPFQLLYRNLKRQIHFWKQKSPERSEESTTRNQRKTRSPSISRPELIMDSYNIRIGKDMSIEPELLEVYHIMCACGVVPSFWHQIFGDRNDIDDMKKLKAEYSSQTNKQSYFKSIRVFTSISAIYFVLWGIRQANQSCDSTKSQLLPSLHVSSSPSSSWHFKGSEKQVPSLVILDKRDFQGYLNRHHIQLHFLVAPLALLKPWRLHRKSLFILCYGKFNKLWPDQVILHFLLLCSVMNSRGVLVWNSDGVSTFGLAARR